MFLLAQPLEWWMTSEGSSSRTKSSLSVLTQPVGHMSVGWFFLDASPSPSPSPAAWVLQWENSMKCVRSLFYRKKKSRCLSQSSIGGSLVTRVNTRGPSRELLNKLSCILLAESCNFISVLWEKWLDPWNGRNCGCNINVNESCSTPWIGETVQRSYTLHEISSFGYIRTCSDSVWVLRGVRDVHRVA